MAITAQIISDDRGSERFAASLDATFRAEITHPHDVTIEDLSLTGFRLSGAPKLAIGAQASIGFVGIGVQQARVMREDGSGYGCEFVAPITQPMLMAALTASSVSLIAFPSSSPLMLADAPEPVVGSYSPRVKLAVVTAAIVAGWAATAGLYFAIT